MIKTLFRPSRRRNGKLVKSDYYSLKLRMDGDLNITVIPLKVTDRRAAEEIRRKIILESERERAGILPPKAQRDSAATALLNHARDFVADLRAMGRNQQYVDELENKLNLLASQCAWSRLSDVTADSFVQWRIKQNKAPKTLNEYLASAIALFNWMIKQGRLVANPLVTVRKAETRGKAKRVRRAYTDDEMRALLNVAGAQRILYMMAALTGIRHGEFQKLRWGDLNFDKTKPSVTVPASVGKNKRLACLPLHPVLFAELLAYRPANVDAGNLIFGRLVPRSDVFNRQLRAAGIAKRDSQGRVVDFHSFRHTFCTNLHLAGVPLREAMELMRHSDVRLTMSVYADSSLFALRPAVEKLPWNCPVNDTQKNTQRSDFGRLLPSLAVTVDGAAKSELQPIEMRLKSLSGTVCHGQPENGKWSERQDSNLRRLAPKASALPG